MLEVAEIYSSPLPLGSGFVNTAHGTIPVPAPATLEILRGIPVYKDGREGELVTPTGAAIISTVANFVQELPPIRVDKIGYGCGKKDFSFPNLLRVYVGELVESTVKERNIVLETNIDDMNPQIFGYLVEKLFKEGALDVFLTPVYMKKGRPGILLSVIAPLVMEERLSEVIFRETTTLGIIFLVYVKFLIPRVVVSLNITSESLSSITKGAITLSKIPGLPFFIYTGVKNTSSAPSLKSFSTK